MDSTTRYGDNAIARCLTLAAVLLLAAGLAAGCDDDESAPPADMPPILDGRVDKRVCGPGTTPCSGQCVNTSGDNKNCGACGNACHSGEVCVTGKCALSCPSGQSKCAGGDAGATFCTNLQTDTSNCGVCGSACKSGEVCVTG